MNLEQKNKHLTAGTVKVLDINYLKEIYISIIARNEVNANGARCISFLSARCPMLKVQHGKKSKAELNTYAKNVMQHWTKFKVAKIT